MKKPIATKPHYVTTKGFKALQDELQYLASKERPEVVAIVSWAASNGDRSENGDYIYGKKRLREIDRRIRYLTKRIESAKVVNPQEQQHLSQVFFGATVSYIDEQDEEKTIQIVGLDEADYKTNKVSYTSPVAKALMKARLGDEVSFITPDGIMTVEVIAINYDN